MSTRIIRSANILLILLIHSGLPANSQGYASGFASKISGEDFEYHSPQPDAKLALLVRSEDSSRYIEWEGGTPCKGYNPCRVLLLAGIDVNPEDPRSWKVFIDGRHHFTIRSPVDTLEKTLRWDSPLGARMEFRATEVDKYGDFMGYLTVELPAHLLEPGKPVRFKVVGESAGSRTWFMIFQYETENRIRLITENAVEYGPDGNQQLLRASVVQYGDPLEAMIWVGDQKFQRTIGFGYNQLHIPVREITRDTLVRVKIAANGIALYDSAFSLKPVPYRTVYLLHHSHNDIGYTHVQDEVERLQWQYLEEAAQLAEQTQEFPEGARFRWNTEVMWALESYLNRTGTDEKREAVIRALKNGWIEPEALYANELVSLCESEELLKLMEPARRMARDYGIRISSAMITDIPGWSWGLVPALAHSGVRYLSLGTNTGHRIGKTIEVWGDRPFWWVSPSGEEKVLCWIHEKGYSLFHTGLDYKKIKKRLQEDLVFDYLNELAGRDYPYNMVMLRYTIGSDNGPVDDYLPEAVKEWNEKYATPKIVISTVGEAFGIFEEKYGTSIPEVRGDFTAYWEDGAYSTARETILNRASAVRLNQAQILHGLNGSGHYPAEAFREAWRNVLLYDEHTWGSWNSISEPETEFTREQWAIKERFARKAHQQSHQLLLSAMPEISPADIPLKALDVFNTCSWARSGLVSLPAEVLPDQPVITSEQGEILPIQRLSDGQWVFLARDIPALGSASYTITPGRAAFRFPDEGAPVPVLENDLFSIRVSEENGALTELTWKAQGIDLAGRDEWSGLNEYVYVAGRNPENAMGVEAARIMRGESGPVLNSLRIISRPPGCRQMETEINLVNGMEEIIISNTLDKEPVYDPEAVHFAFPFRVPGGKTRYDLAFAHCLLEDDQIKGSNRNFITLENWADVSNDAFGVTLACPDAPLFQSGKITMDEIVTGWRERLEPSSTVISYVMNNYWETNFAAAQEGMASFSYMIRPHQGFDAAAAERFGMESRYPLIAVPARGHSSSGAGQRAKGKGQSGVRDGLSQQSILPIHPKDHGVILVSLRPAVSGTGHVACLHNASEEEISFVVNTKGYEYYETDVDGSIPKQQLKSLLFTPKAIRFVLVVNK